VRHYPHLRISARGLGLSGTSTHLTRQLSGTHYDLSALLAPLTLHQSRGAVVIAESTLIALSGRSCIIIRLTRSALPLSMTSVAALRDMLAVA